MSFLHYNFNTRTFVSENEYNEIIYTDPEQSQNYLAVETYGTTSLNPDSFSGANSIQMGPHSGVQTLQSEPMVGVDGDVSLVTHFKFSPDNIPQGSNYTSIITFNLYTDGIDYYDKYVYFKAEFYYYPNYPTKYGFYAFLWINENQVFNYDFPFIPLENEWNKMELITLGDLVLLKLNDVVVINEYSIIQFPLARSTWYEVWGPHIPILVDEVLFETYVPQPVIPTGPILFIGPTRQFHTIMDAVNSIPKDISLVNSFIVLVIDPGIYNEEVIINLQYGGPKEWFIRGYGSSPSDIQITKLSIIDSYKHSIQRIYTEFLSINEVNMYGFLQYDPYFSLSVLNFQRTIINNITENGSITPPFWLDIRYSNITGNFYSQQGSKNTTTILKCIVNNGMPSGDYLSLDYVTSNQEGYGIDTIPNPPFFVSNSPCITSV